MVRNLLGCSLLFFLSTQALAGIDEFWPDRANTHFNKYHSPHDNGHMISIWGICNEHQPDWDQITGNPEITRVPSTYYRKGFFPLAMNLQRSESADLVVLITGAFTNLDDGQGYRMMDSLFKTGKSVVWFANPLGSQMLLQGPTFKPANFMKEREAYYQALQEVRLLLKNRGKKPEQVDIMGISYGAFMAGILFDRDQHSDDPFINGMATLLAPPYNIGRSMELLDQGMEATKDLYSHTPTLSYGRTLFSFCNWEAGAPLSKKQEVKARYLAHHMGFFDWFQKALVAYSDEWNLDIVPKNRGWGPFARKFRKWKKELRFIKFYANFAPEIIELINSPLGDLIYWIDRNPGKIRVMTADDDFINDPGIWPVRDELQIFSDGGHYGYRALDWYEELLKAIY